MTKENLTWKINKISETKSMLSLGSMKTKPPLQGYHGKLKNKECNYNISTIIIHQPMMV